eukprot:Rhum_TRINITY_DN14262_c2_g1::Rhum_TRINITY_DN14262_c2_g1_i1::g.73740::m.73740
MSPCFVSKPPSGSLPNSWGGRSSALAASPSSSSLSSNASAKILQQHGEFPPSATASAAAAATTPLSPLSPPRTPPASHRAAAGTPVLLHGHVTPATSPLMSPIGTREYPPSSPGGAGTPRHPLAAASTPPRSPFTFFADPGTPHFPACAAAAGGLRTPPSSLASAAAYYPGGGSGCAEASGSTPGRRKTAPRSTASPHTIPAVSPQRGLTRGFGSSCGGFTPPADASPFSTPPSLLPVSTDPSAAAGGGYAFAQTTPLSYQLSLGGGGAGIGGGAPPRPSMRRSLFSTSSQHSGYAGGYPDSPAPPSHTSPRMRHTSTSSLSQDGDGAFELLSDASAQHRVGAWSDAGCAADGTEADEDEDDKDNRLAQCYTLITPVLVDPVGSGPPDPYARVCGGGTALRSVSGSGRVIRCPASVGVQAATAGTGDGPAGNFAAVQCVQQNIDRRTYAVKRLIEGLNGSDEDRAEKVREAEILRLCDHPNIVRYFTSWVEYKGNFCIIMDWCNGGSVRSFFEKERDELTLVQALSHVGSALEYMHSFLNVVHFDVKFENVMASHAKKGDRWQTTFKLCDFGLSREAHSVASAVELEVGDARYCDQHILNPPFSPPEKLFAADTFSLGISCYEVARCTPVGGGTDEFQELRARSEETLEGELAATVSPSLARWIASLMCPVETRASLSAVVREASALLRERVHPGEACSN